MRRILFMRGKGQPFRLGPFIGGLNTAADPSAVADTELVDCVNFELDIDGSLKCRPPIRNVADLSGTWTERIVILGVAVFAGGTFVIGSNTNGVYKFDGTTWVSITGTFQASSFVQYANKIWLVAIPGSANPGGSWDGTTFTAIAAIPKGTACTIYKERMWVAPGNTATTNESRLSFSAVADPATWNGADFFDVSPGTGEKLIDLIVFNNNLLLFKNDSTYALSYDTKPTDAVITKISNTIGATTKRCVVNTQNSVFVYHEGNVYELVNYTWVQINVKVPFVYDSSAPSTRVENVFMSYVGNRVVVRYFNNIYVYNLNTRIWTRWASGSSELHNFGPIVPYPSDVTQNVNDLYYMGSSLTASKRVFAINDGFDAITTEVFQSTSFSINCTLQTKNYDMNLPFKYKRLYWWGAEVITTKDVIGTATPVVFGFQAAWQDLENRTWDSLGTWAQPLANLAVPTTVTGSAGTARRFLKFNKGLRYRQIFFTLSLQSDGSINDGPAKVYTLVLVTYFGATVAKAAS